MPPWTSRFHVGSPSTAKSGQPTKSSGPRSPTSSKNTHAGLVQDPPLIGVPIFVPPGTPRRSPTGSVHHIRSRSHPFPSAAGVDRPSLEFEENLNIFNNGPVVPANPTNFPYREQPGLGSSPHSPYGGEQELVAGKCATCDSLVRWPRQLDVFRCTVCLMVNDLKVVSIGTPETQRGNDVGPQRKASPSDRVSKGTRVTGVMMLIEVPANISDSASPFAWKDTHLDQRMYRPLPTFAPRTGAPVSSSCFNDNACENF